MPVGAFDADALQSQPFDGRCRRVGQRTTGAAVIFDAGSRRRRRGRREAVMNGVDVTQDRIETVVVVVYQLTKKCVEWMDLEDLLLDPSVADKDGDSGEVFVRFGGRLF